MRIAKNPKNKKIIILLSAIAVVLIGAIAYAAYRAQTASQSDKQSQVNQVNYDPPTEEEQKQGDANKAAIIEEEQKQQNPGSGSENSVAAPFSVAISRADQAGVGQPLNIRTTISGTSSGTCEVTLTKSGQPIVAKSFPVTFEATYATCQGADISTSDFGASGEWNLKVVVKKDNQASHAAEQKVTIAK